MARWLLSVDGASRNNPGPAGAGIVLSKDGEEIVKQGFYLGNKTNNQAEYFALLLGVFYAQRHMVANDTLVIQSDSELLVRQMNGEYKIKSPDLQHLFSCVQERLRSLSFVVRHVRREQNAAADKMANLGIDKKIPVPAEFSGLCTPETNLVIPAE